MLTELANGWWLVLLRGLCALAFGVLAFMWPGLSLLTLVLLYGIYALADGVLAIGAAVTGRRGAVPTWWLVLIGALGIAAGIVTFSWPGLTAIALLVTIAVWAIVKGAGEIAGAIALRKHVENEWLLVLSGLLSVVFGALLLTSPGAGALALAWLIAAWAIAFGIVHVGLAFRLRALKQHVPGHPGAVPRHA